MWDTAERAMSRPNAVFSCTECGEPCGHGFPEDATTGNWYCGVCWTEWYRLGFELFLRFKLRVPGMMLQEMDVPWVLISDFLNEYRWGADCE